MLVLNRLARRLFLGLLLIAAQTLPTLAHSLEELEEKLKDRERYAQIVNYPAPEFRLRGLDGGAVSLADLGGKVVILWFVYTKCPDVSPLHSEALASIQEQVNQTPMRELVQFITITTDPEHDTLKVLQDYGPKHGLDPINWTVLTSGPEGRTFCYPRNRGKIRAKVHAGGRWIPNAWRGHSLDRQER